MKQKSILISSPCKSSGSRWGFITQAVIIASTLFYHMTNKQACHTALARNIVVFVRFDHICFWTFQERRSCVDTRRTNVRHIWSSRYLVQFLRIFWKKKSIWTIQIYHVYQLIMGNPWAKDEGNQFFKHGPHFCVFTRSSGTFSLKCFRRVKHERQQMSVCRVIRTSYMRNPCVPKKNVNL